MLFGHIIPRSAAQEAGKQEAHEQESSGALMDRKLYHSAIQPFARLSGQAGAACRGAAAPQPEQKIRAARTARSG